MVFIYVLELENHKYYVGETDNPCFRLNEYSKEQQNEWTILHRPLMLLEFIFKDDIEMTVDTYTIKTMKRYGIYNVRGGKYSSMFFSDGQMREIKEEIKNFSSSSSNSNSHPNSGNNNYKSLEYEYLQSDDETKNTKTMIKTEYFCYRCGRIGHNIDECFEDTYITGQKIYARVYNPMVIYKREQQELEKLKDKTCWEYFFSC